MLALDLDSDWNLRSAQAFRTGMPAIETFICQTGGTPMPIDLGCDALFYQPTGPVVIFKPIGSLVEGALSHTEKLAVLPLDEADEATVDALVKRRLGETKVRRLTPR